MTGDPAIDGRRPLLLVCIVAAGPARGRADRLRIGVVGFSEAALMDSLLGRRCMLDVRDKVPESLEIGTTSDGSTPPIRVSSGS